MLDLEVLFKQYTNPMLSNIINSAGFFLNLFLENGQPHTKTDRVHPDRCVG